MVEIESILRQCDPTVGTAIPSPDSPEGSSIRARALDNSTQLAEHTSSARLNRRFTVSIAALTAVAAAIVLLVTLLPAQLDTQGSSAAAALIDLASTAGSQPILGSGQFTYSEVELKPTGVTVSGATGSNESWTQYSEGTVQTWIAADGSGRQVTTTDLNPQFLTAADKTNWARSGGKFDEPPSYVVTDEHFGQGGKSLTGNQLGESRALPYNVSTLPTDPTPLAKTLCDTNKWRALSSAVSSVTGYSVTGTQTPGCQLFGIVVTLLQGPDIGSTPALRQALFKVLASVPGVRLIGKTTDTAGARGTGLQLVDRVPAGSTKITCASGTSTGNSGQKTFVEHQPATATIYTVIIDPSTATLLSLERSFTPLKVKFESPCIPDTGNQLVEQIPDSSVLLSSGVVDSTTAVRKGTVEECAVGSIPTPPWETCRGARDDGGK
jgi:hypothetical protein